MGVIFQFPYRTVAEISLGALLKNLYTLRSRCRREIIPVVKADAYGHGAVPVCRALISRGGIQVVAVATLEEAMELRNRLPHSISIIVLSGFVPHQLGAYNRYHLIPVIHSLSHLKAIQGNELLPEIHLKVDTGMNRLGLKADELPEAMELLGRMKIKLAGLGTHFAESEVSVSEFSEAQLAAFEGMQVALREKRLLNTDARIHVANSGAVLQGRLGSSLAVRPGLSLYGISPNPQMEGASELIPALEWKSRVLSFKSLQRGESVGYGRTYQSEGAERLAIVPIGYADGLPRLLSNKGSVLLGGQRRPIRGRVSMDLTTVGCEGVADLREGSVVTLIGRDGEASISAWDVAHWAQTIPYEILCGLSPRVTRVYLD